MAALLLAVFAGSAGLRNVTAQGASVMINEVELNPRGQDAGNEWIGLYNPTGADVNIDNYKVIMTTSSSTITISIPAGVVGAGQFYVFAVQGQTLANAGLLTLVDGASQVLDKTPSLVDKSDDSRTWQRVPDGGSQWKFTDGTRDKPNDPATYKGKSGSNEVSPSTQSTNTSGKCQGSGMCLEGTVVRVSEANIIYVKKEGDSVPYKVTLSLTKATGKSDRAVTQAMCFGTNALVDQDDKQPGRGKSITGVVYCASQNLNQQLLDAGIVGVDSRQCGTSEFAGQDWARKYC